jgi:hypothetical protein
VLTATLGNRNTQQASARACWQFLIGAPLDIGVKN